MRTVLIHWRVFTDAKSLPAARRVSNRVLAKLEMPPDAADIVPYPKTGGHDIAFTQEISVDSWRDAVYSLLVLFKHLGDGVGLNGSIDTALHVSLTRSSVSGAQTIFCEMQRPPDLPE
jgi:hypothetical protein